MNKLIVLCLCVLLSVALVGCKSKKKPAAGDNETVSPKKSQATAHSDKTDQDQTQLVSVHAKEPKVIVTVNGKAIAEAQLQERINKQQTPVQKDMPESFKEQYEKALRDKLLNEMVMETLLSQKIREKRIVVSAEEVNRCIENQCRSQKMNQKDLLELLDAKGQTFDEYKESIRKELQFEKVIQAELSERIEISEDTKKNYYLVHSEEYELPEQVRISRIFLRVPPDSTETAKTDTMKVGQELLSRIKNGENFGALAKKYSDAPSAARGGDDGFFKKGQLKPELEKAVFGLAAGQVSDLIETADGYSVLQVTEHKQAQTQPYEEVRNEIHTVLLSEKIKESAGSYLDEIKAQATIIHHN